MRMRPGGLWWVALGLLAVNLGSAAVLARPRLPPVAPPAETASVCLAQASARELASLPGIGPRLAERIAAYRDSHPGMRPADLVLVRGIGRKRAGRLAGLLTE